MLKRIFIRRRETDPYFNLALEEYMLRHSPHPLLMLWQNSPAVVIGKHQNMEKEVDIDYAKTHDVKMIRRISGGGTVYHDLGNVNFTILNIYTDNAKIDFTTYLKPFIGFLHSLGLAAEQTGVSNISINGYKCSGNACHLYKNRAIYHGTLLFDADIEQLNKVITSPQAEYISDKSIDSVRVQVRNIKEQLSCVPNVSQFIETLQTYLLAYYNDLQSDDFIVQNKAAIQALANDKYKSWLWNMGYAPDFNIQKKILIEGKSVLFLCTVSKGLIKKIAFSPPVAPSIAQKLTHLEGCNYDKERLNTALRNMSK